MLKPDKKILRAVMISLMLVVGSVQAQVSYYCGMMDTVMHADCCCADADIDDMAVSNGEPCCDKSVELVVDNSTDLAQPTAKPTKFSSDVDPPDVLVLVISVASTTRIDSILTSVNVADWFQTNRRSTYLSTRRLRI